jgi:SAM-dependent methyltransferase
MFEKLEAIHDRPEPFEFYTASDLWTDDHISEHMLRYHLDEGGEIASRTAAFIDRSVEWIVSRFRVSSDTRIADFGCGPGLYTTRLARKRAKMTGIDFSARSIQHATREAEQAGLSICYRNENYLEFETEERFDLVTMITCDFCALSPAQRQQMLVKFSRLLKPGGHVLLDVYSSAAFEQRKETARYELSPRDGFWSPGRYYEFWNTFKFEQEQLILDKYTIIEANRVRTIYNWLQCFDPDGIKREFEACGLPVAEFYADVAGTVFDASSSEFAVVARRP